MKSGEDAHLGETPAGASLFPRLYLSQDGATPPGDTVARAGPFPGAFSRDPGGTVIATRAGATVTSRSAPLRLPRGEICGRATRAAPARSFWRWCSFSAFP